MVYVYSVYGRVSCGALPLLYVLSRAGAAVTCLHVNLAAESAYDARVNETCLYPVALLLSKLDTP